ncbi:hypothetical protein VUR80DRAFT_573 [Thermomyces stellatus]
MSDPGDGLLAISLSDSDDQSAARPDARPGASRTGQSSEAFEAVKRGYVAKVEEGEIWKSVSLPLRNPSKQELQGVLHAVEELYFFRRFEEALGFLGRVLEGPEGLGSEEKAVLESYERKCREKLELG